MSFDLALVNGDFEFGPDGNPIQVTGKDKLAQDIGKSLLTKIGFDPGDINFGSDLNTYIGQLFDPTLLQGMVAKSVSNSMTYLQSLQLAQSVKQAMTYDEILGIVDAIAVNQPAPGKVQVQMMVRSVNGLRQTLAIDLAGPTGS